MYEDQRRFCESDKEAVRPNDGQDKRPSFIRRQCAGFLAALVFLLPMPRRDRVARVLGKCDFAFYIVPVGLLIGLAWAGTFRLMWRTYGETAGLRLMPSLTVVAMELAFTGALLVLGLSHTVGAFVRRRPMPSDGDETPNLTDVGVLVLCLTALIQFGLVLAVRATPGWWPPPDDWRSVFNFLYPHPIYRPMLLAPIWGRWGILLAATVGRTARGADPFTVRLNRLMTPGRLLRHTALPMLLTAIYCSRSRNYIMTGVLIGLLVFAVTYVAVVAFARRGGGQTRHSLFAAGMIAQIAFMVIYLGLWRLIDL